MSFAQNFTHEHNTKNQSNKHSKMMNVSLFDSYLDDISLLISISKANFEIPQITLTELSNVKTQR